MMQQLHRIKVLFLTFTLLCLVCNASLLSETEQLDMIKDNILRGEQNLAKLKVQLELIINHYEEQENKYRNILEQIPVPPGKELLDHVKDSMNKAKTGVKAKKEELQAQIYEVENELKDQRKIIEKFFPTHVMQMKTEL